MMKNISHAGRLGFVTMLFICGFKAFWELLGFS